METRPVEESDPRPRPGPVFSDVASLFSFPFPFHSRLLLSRRRTESPPQQQPEKKKPSASSHVRRGGGERRRAQDRRRVSQGQVPDELRGGDNPGAQVGAAAAHVGRRRRPGLAGVREVAGLRQALQPLQEPRRRAPGPRDALPLQPRRVRALHPRQPLPRHRRRGQGPRPLPRPRRQVRLRRPGRQDAQRPIPHQEVRVVPLLVFIQMDLVDMEMGMEIRLPPLPSMVSFISLKKYF